MSEAKPMSSVHLGPKNLIATFPHPVDIQGETYYLTICNDQYRLLSSICPHAGGQVVIYDDKLVCPLHMWTFDASSGQCLVVRGASLEHYEVKEEQGQLVAHMPQSIEGGS